MAAVLAMLTFVGCAVTRPVAVPLPVVAETTPEQTIKVDRKKLAELLAPCPIVEPVALIPDESVRVANARKDALIKCNKDKAELRAATGIEVK